MLTKILIQPFGRFPILLLLLLSVASCGGDSGGNTTAPPPPPPSGFTDITNSSGLNFTVGYSEEPGDNGMISTFAGGVAAGDYDADGDIDLFVVRGDAGPNLLYRNDGNNPLTDVAAPAGLHYTKHAREN